jgi:hypothetical protein
MEHEERNTEEEETSEEKDLSSRSHRD